MLALASVAMAGASYTLSMSAIRRVRLAVLLGVAGAALAASLATEITGHWQSGLRPSASGYAAMVYMAAFLQFQVVAAVCLMVLFSLARVLTHRVDQVRRVTVDNTAILLHYAVAQGLLGLLLVHGFPRVVA
jgi:cytochrome c oxidase subunit I+III